MRNRPSAQKCGSAADGWAWRGRSPVPSLYRHAILSTLVGLVVVAMASCEGTRPADSTAQDPQIDANAAQDAATEGGRAAAGGDDKRLPADTGDGRLPRMTFFVTSRALGCPASCGGLCGYDEDDNAVDENDGNDCSSGSGNLGGLDRADAHCQALAVAVGAGDLTWRAYLSVTPRSGADPVAVVHARDRIGNGPWHNASGDLIAGDVAALHELVDERADQHQRGKGPYGQATNGINQRTALTETGVQLHGLVSRPSGGDHDILTGTRLDGTAYPEDSNATCDNWTNGSRRFRVRVGHSDHAGLESADNNGRSWNSAHTPYCSAEGLDSTAGAGYFYCFAAE